MDNTSFVLKKIKENFNSFVAKTYEDICIEYTLKNEELLKCGRWWNKKEEIDVVGIGEDFLIIGECKYSNKKVGTDILDKLKEKSKHIELKLPIKKYILFSKSGFTDDMIKLSQEDSTIVIVQKILN